jgi:Zn-dependent protease
MDVLILIPVLLFSVVVHEVAHALVAKWEGDDTAHRLGRITLNPLPHLDLMGSVIVPLALYFLPGQFIFGWAKPVPVNPNNFRDPKWGDIRVSLAGITANLLLAAASVVLLLVALKAMPLAGALEGAFMVLQEAAFYGVFLNLILAFFNLIPIPPLDGSHVLYHLLPPAVGARYREVGKYGIGIIMVLVFFVPGSFRVLLWPVEFLMIQVDRLVGLWI